MERRAKAFAGAEIAYHAGNFLKPLLKQWFKSVTTAWGTAAAAYGRGRAFPE
jgi:hypothetical protein